MKYFTIKQKENIPNTAKLLLKTDSGFQARQSLDIEDAASIKDSVAISVQSSIHNIYPDIIDRPVFLVSDEIKRVLELYDNSLIFKNVILTDIIYKIQKVYWLVLMEKISCLSNKAEFDKASNIKKIVLDSKKTEDKKMFLIAGIREVRVVINLDIAESLLRRFFLGVNLEEVGVDYDN